MNLFILTSFLVYSITIFSIIYLSFIFYSLYYAKKCHFFEVDNQVSKIVIVLGSTLVNDDIPNFLKLRLDTSLRFNNGNACYVVTGGYTKNSSKSEASIMKEYLVKRKVDSNKIFIDEESTNTFENIENAKKIINENIFLERIDEKIIVTSDYHIARAHVICHFLKLKVIPCCSDSKLMFFFKRSIQELKKIFYIIVKNI